MHTMDEKENKEKECGTKTRQQITVPFLWEVKPGVPKDDWKTPKREHEQLTHDHQPVKYVASVPFIWEEKPGTPLCSLACFNQEATTQHSTVETVVENRCLPLPPAYFANLGNESDVDSSCGDDYDCRDWMSELDFEAISVRSEESFSSAPSLLQANHLNPIKVTVSSAIPLQNPFLIQQNDEYTDGSSSPEDDCSPRSYASRNASLRGASFLQQLFPLYPPKSGFLDKPNASVKKGNVHFSTELQLPTLEEDKKLDTEFKRRRPLTLQELIIQRRRMSCRRKAVQMREKNLPKGFDKKTPGCFNLRANGGGLTKLLAKDLMMFKLS